MNYYLILLNKLFKLNFYKFIILYNHAFKRF